MPLVKRVENEHVFQTVWCNECRRNVLNFHPQIVKTDFAVSIIHSAIATIFPETQIIGCRFHLENKNAYVPLATCEGAIDVFYFSLSNGRQLEMWSDV